MATNALKLAKLFDQYEVMVVLPGGDGWFTEEEKRLIASALRSYRAPVACTCHSQRDRELCLRKSECAEVTALTDSGDKHG